VDSATQAPARPAQIAGSESPSSDQRSSDYDVLRLTTLLGVARMLTSELDLAEIVRQVLVRAIEVIPAADAGTLFLVDQESGRLVVSDSVGLDPASSTCRWSPARLPQDGPSLQNAEQSTPIRKQCRAPSRMQNLRLTENFEKRA
jgi:hypothetical protein